MQSLSHWTTKEVLLIVCNVFKGETEWLGTIEFGENTVLSSSGCYIACSPLEINESGCLDDVHTGLPEEEMPFTVQKGLPGGTSGEEADCQHRRHKKHGFKPCVGKSP